MNFASLRLAYDQNDSMPLIWQLPRANSLRMDAEMPLITHVYQPIAPPAIRVDDAREGTWPRIAACSGFLEAVQDDLRVDISLPFQDSKDDCFTPGSTPLFSPNTAGAKRRWRSTGKRGSVSAERSARRDGRRTNAGRRRQWPALYCLHPKSDGPHFGLREKWRRSGHPLQPRRKKAMRRHKVGRFWLVA